MEKILSKLLAFGANLVGFKAYGFIILILIICGLGVPIPEDITLILAGFLASQGNISLSGAFVVGFVGVLIGDTFLFFLGRKFGYRVFRLKLIKGIFSEKRLQKAKNRIHRNSKFICFTARFLPGLRASIYLVSGAMKVSPFVFLFLDGFAALISVPIWVYLGWYLGTEIDFENLFESEAFQQIKDIQFYFFAGIVFIITIYVGRSFYKNYKAKRDQ